MELTTWKVEGRHQINLRLCCPERRGRLWIAWQHTPLPTWFYVEIVVLTILVDRLAGSR